MNNSPNSTRSQEGLLGPISAHPVISTVVKARLIWNMASVIRRLGISTSSLHQQWQSSFSDS